MKYDQVKGQGLILQKGTKNVLLFDKKGFIDNTKSRQSLSGQWTKQSISIFIFIMTSVESTILSKFCRKKQRKVFVITKRV